VTEEPPQRRKMKKAECMRSAVGLEPTLLKPKKINKR
jgi:hypothetical protein